jgi:hypothetical protein
VVGIQYLAQQDHPEERFDEQETFLRGDGVGFLVRRFASSCADFFEWFNWG